MLEGGREGRRDYGRWLLCSVVGGFHTTIDKRDDNVSIGLCQSEKIDTVRSKCCYHVCLLPCEVQQLQIAISYTFGDTYLNQFVTNGDVTNGKSVLGIGMVHSVAYFRVEVM